MTHRGPFQPRTFCDSVIPSTSLILCGGSAVYCCFRALKASFRVDANKHTSTLADAKNDIFVSAHREKEGLIMHKHNNSAWRCEREVAL